ncbi:hypothetical protein [Mycolicibacterium iranicum]|uniref:hypothetical protein n=1 Tax=Mycolicibacterium iranicum TaxID=912594 RepID=UPI0013A5B49F|nr:hypothetical protein [Mycolicibacterium iranicum]
MNAETVGEMVTGLARIAERLNVADPKGDSAESARRLTEHLASRRVGDALLVFDNATDPDELKKYIPPVGTRVVITSTSRSFTELGTPIDVSEYTPEESIGYLTQRTGLDDQAGASRIAEELGTCRSPFRRPLRPSRRDGSTTVLTSHCCKNGRSSRSCPAAKEAATRVRSRPL